MRKAMVEKSGCALSVRCQCELLGVNRNRLESGRDGALSSEEQVLARRIDEVHLRFPEFGARRMGLFLRREGLQEATRRRVAAVMRKMGVEAVYRRPRTSAPCKSHQKYPYLLGSREITEADEAWCADVTYIPMVRGFAYLVAVMDWGTRAVISWRLSNTLDGSFCVEALREAFAKTGRSPNIFNTDQGCQFTSRPWLNVLEGAGVKVSTDGKGRWVDNVFIERLWRSVKHEGVYLWAYENLHELEKALARWFDDYNRWKPHQALDGKTPWECYRPDDPQPWRLAA